MTPLEEIELAISTLHQEIAATVNDEHALIAMGAILAALYQARAIERLESTVRVIGVHLQNSVSPAIPQPTLEDIANQERNRSTPFQPPGHCFTPSAVGSGICYYCGHPAGSQEHHRRPK